MIGVYGLIDPRNGKLRYVGASKNIWRRYSDHCKGRADYILEKMDWIAELQQLKLQPWLVVLAPAMNNSEMRKAKREQIAKYTAEGQADLNRCRPFTIYKFASSLRVRRRAIEMLQQALARQREELEARTRVQPPRCKVRVLQSNADT